MVAGRPAAAPAPCFAYSTLGALVHSEFELPELTAATAGAGPPSIAIHRGKVMPGEGTPAGDEETPAYIVGDDRFFLERDGVGRFEVAGGRTVTVDVYAAAADVDVRVYLLGSVLGALCHQRGLLPLHAGAVGHSGKAFAFAGRSGTGKSTISAGLSDRGFSFVADDVCPIALDPTEGPRVLENVRKVKLAADALDAFGQAADDRLRDHQDAPRYHVPASGPTPPFPMTLAGIYMFRRTEHAPGKPRIETIAPAYAIPCIQRLTYMPRYPAAAGCAGRHFRQCASIATKVPLFEVYYRPGLEHLDTLLAGLAEHMRGEAS
jgi:hypothetical protein